MSELSRNDFLKLTGIAGTATALSRVTRPAPADAAPPPTHPPKTTAASKKAKNLRSEPLAFTFLTVPEQAFVEAAIDRLIPRDASSPGAKDAGVAYFIDQQLAGAWGSGARQYRQGPWQQGTPEQGFQLNMIPQQIYRVGIAATNAYCTKKYGKTFDALSPALQDEVLHGLEKGTIELEEVPSKTFFQFLFGNTVEGFFADPIYGGNRDKVGWKAIGFPGVAAAYVGVIEKYNTPYRVEPVGIADVEQGIARDDMDAHRRRVAQMYRGSREA